MKKVILGIVSSCLLTTLHLELLTKQIHIIPYLRPLFTGQGIWIRQISDYSIGRIAFGESYYKISNLE